MAEIIDWKTVLGQLIASLIPLLIAAIMNWLKEAAVEDAVAVGDKAGKAYNAFRNA